MAHTALVRLLDKAISQAGGFPWLYQVFQIFCANQRKSGVSFLHNKSKRELVCKKEGSRNQSSIKAVASVSTGSKISDLPPIASGNWHAFKQIFGLNGNYIAIIKG
jgi:hypothetical protein